MKFSTIPSPFLARPMLLLVTLIAGLSLKAADPWLIGQWPGTNDLTGGTSVFGVAVAGHHAYLAAGSAGIRVIDISNPSQPQSLTSLVTGKGAMGVVVAGDDAFVAGGVFASGLNVVDVSNPATPVRVGGLPALGEAMGLAVAGNYAYVADNFSGLKIIDIANPAKPQVVGGLPVAELVWPVEDVVVAGNYAYLATYNRGFNVIDVSDPSNPQKVGGYDPNPKSPDPDSFYGLAVLGHYAYIANGDQQSGLMVIDIADPANPQPVGKHATSGAAWDVAVAGNRAYVAVRDAGLEVFDITDPIRPVRVGGFDTPGDAVGVTVVGDLIYVADTNWGLQIFRIAGPALTFQRKGQTLSLSWPVTAIGSVLQSATTLANGGDWRDSPLAPAVADDQNVATVDPASSAAFFRLRSR